jgi:photosystem II stability/assembly factor-like uncharacterized protein
MSFIDEKEGWILGIGLREPLEIGAFLFHTTDGGKTWAKQPKRIQWPIADIKALPDGNVWTIGYADGTIFHSGNRGKSWRRVIIH